MSRALNLALGLVAALAGDYPGPIDPSLRKFLRGSNKKPVADFRNCPPPSYNPQEYHKANAASNRKSGKNKSRAQRKGKK